MAALAHRVDGLVGAALAGALSLVYASPARAHLGHVVDRAERYVKLDVTPGDARIVVSLTLGPAEMASVLGAADADRDGRVTDEEADAYVRTWSAGLDEELAVRIGGERVDLVWGEPFLEPAGAVRPVVGTVELVGHAVLGAGRVPIVFEDRMQRPVFDRTDVSLEARNGVHLVAAGPGEAPAGNVPRFAFGPEAPRPVVFAAVVDTPEALVPRADRRPILLWMLGAMTAAAALAFGASRALRRVFERRAR